MNEQLAATVEPPAIASSWRGELKDLFQLAWPLVIAQLARNALLVTDVIMMGWLGPKYLAAGTLGTTLLNTLFLFGIGIVSAVAPIVAQSLGRRDRRTVRRAVRQGFWVAILIGAVLAPVLWQARPILIALGQAPDTSLLAEAFMHTALWMVFPALMIIVLQAFLSAHGDTRTILVITVLGVPINALLGYGLIFGNFGLPQLGLMGSGIATSLVNLVMFVAMLAYVQTHRKYRRYHIFARFWRPDWERFREIFRIGIPIGFTLLSEVGLFAIAAIMMGWLSTEELAAHSIALQCASLAFMVPLGLGQAATVRVGLAYGRKDREGIRKAGWTALVLGMGFMASTCLLFLLAPNLLVRLFLDPAVAENQATLAFAATLLVVAGLFQLVDGAQVIGVSNLRGLSDTKIPMILAFVGYWLVGLPVSYFTGFTLGWRGVGVWLGLAAGLAFVAVVLNTRFALRERLNLIKL